MEKSNLLSDLLTDFFALMEAKGIPYCVLRGYEKLPYWTRYDIDLAILPEHIEHVEKILDSVYPGQGWIRISGMDSYGFKRFLLYHPHYDKLLLPIDLCLEFTEWGFPYANNKTVLASRLRMGNIWIAAPGCEAAIQILKHLIRFGEFRKNDVIKSKIIRLSRNDPENFVNVLKPYLGKTQTSEILELSQSGRWHDLRKMRKKILANIIKRTGIIYLAFQILRWFLNSVWIKLRRKGGMWVKGGCFAVFLGPDGAGKSTITKATCEKIGNLFNGTIFFHSNFNILPKLKMIRKFYYSICRKPMPTDTDFTARHSGALVKPHSIIKSILYISYYGLEFILGRFIIAWHMRKNRLVVFDRYFYDYYFMKAYANSPKFLLNIFKKLIPQPGVIIVCNCNPDIIYMRKDELTIDEIIRQQEIIKSLNLKNSLSINTSENIENTVYSVSKFIMSKI